jgi:hypothetical protein
MELPDDPLEWPQYGGLTFDRYRIVRQTAGAALQKYHEDNEWGAYEEVRGITDDHEKMVLWMILKPHSSLRACIKAFAHAEWNSE